MLEYISVHFVAFNHVLFEQTLLKQSTGYLKIWKENTASLSHFYINKYCWNQIYRQTTIPYFQFHYKLKGYVKSQITI